MRFRQSYAKTLLEYCPAVLKRQLDGERRTTKAMDAGSLVDYVLFKRTDLFEVVDARYKSGPRQGEPAADWTCGEAREQAEEIRARGLLPVLECELDAAEEEAAPVRKRLDELVGGNTLFEQPKLLWVSTLGVECAGTPDAVIVEHSAGVRLLTVVDIKRTDQRLKKLQRQVYEMGWDVQAAAYEEGALYCERQMGGPDDIVLYQRHVILTVDGVAPPCARELEPFYREIGRRRWEKAQRIFRECVDSGNWPGYPETPIEASYYLVRTMERGELDETQQSEVEVEP
jgi:hypothetical protein